jgi:hypothetical protein
MSTDGLTSTYVGDGGIGMLAEQLNLMSRTIKASSETPVSVRLVGSGLTDASGNVWIGLGRVPQGRTYYVRNLVVGGATWSTTATGTCIVAVTPSDAITNDTQPSTNYVRDAIPPVGGGAATLPGIAWYEAGQFVVRSQETLMVFITNGTAASGTAYVAAATVDNLPATGSTAG